MTATWIAFADEHPPPPDTFPGGLQKVQLYSPDKPRPWPKVFDEFLSTVHFDLKQRDREWFGATHWRPTRTDEPEAMTP